MEVFLTLIQGRYQGNNWERGVDSSSMFHLFILLPPCSSSPGLTASNLITTSYPALLFLSPCLLKLLAIYPVSVLLCLYLPQLYCFVSCLLSYSISACSFLSHSSSRFHVHSTSHTRISRTIFWFSSSKKIIFSTSQTGLNTAACSYASQCYYSGLWITTVCHWLAPTQPVWTPWHVNASSDRLLLLPRGEPSTWF